MLVDLGKVSERLRVGTAQKALTVSVRGLNPFLVERAIVSVDQRAKIPATGTFFPPLTAPLGEP